MPATDLVHRDRTFDLTRPPSEQWNDEMLKLVGATVLKGATTASEQYYCLAVADSLNLNPFIDEIYFIKVKSRDGEGKVLKPYIGRNGLVAKATERGAYFEAQEVHEHDTFEVERTRTGKINLTHKWSNPRERGEIIGAYAFLHGHWRHPAFAYIDIAEYLPDFDQQWKRDASPWYNQRAAMAKKCAMIVAGRERLNLGGVLADGEIDRVGQQLEAGPPRRREVEGAASEFDFDSLEAPRALRDRLRAAVAAAPESWPPAKLELLTTHMGVDELTALAERIEMQAAEAHAPASEPAPAAEEEEEVADAVVVPEPTREERERAEMLQARIAGLYERLNVAESDDEIEQLQEEIDAVGAELAAVGDASQTRLI